MNVFFSTTFLIICYQSAWAGTASLGIGFATEVYWKVSRIEKFKSLSSSLQNCRDLISPWDLGTSTARSNCIQDKKSQSIRWRHQADCSWIELAKPMAIVTPCSGTFSCVLCMLWRQLIQCSYNISNFPPKIISKSRRHWSWNKNI